MTDLQFKRAHEHCKKIEDLASELAATIRDIFSDRGDLPWVDVSRNLLEVASEGFDEIAALSSVEKKDWFGQVEISEDVQRQKKQYIPFNLEGD